MSQMCGPFFARKKQKRLTVFRKRQRNFAAESRKTRNINFTLIP